MGRAVKRGDVYWCSSRSPDKRRPVVVLTRDSAISFLAGITVAPISTTVRGMASEVTLTPEQDGVLNICAVNVDNIQTLQKSRLDEFLTHLSADRMREVRSAIEFALGFDAF